MESYSHFTHYGNQNHTSNTNSKHTSMRDLICGMATSNTTNGLTNSLYATSINADDPYQALTTPASPMSKEMLAEYESDYMFMKSLYSNVVRIIQEEVDEQCDQLEYAGSCMFDKYPDKVHLGTIINIIYNKVQNLDKDNPELQAEELSSNPLTALSYRRCNGFACPPPPPISDFNQFGRPLWLRNLIEVMLYNEILFRRRRFHCHNCR